MSRPKNARWYVYFGAISGRWNWSAYGPLGGTIGTAKSWAEGAAKAQAAAKSLEPPERAA